MNFHVDRRLLLVAAVLGAVGLFAIGFFVALGVRAVVAGPDSAPAAQAPPVSHTYDQIELLGGTWPGLDADTVDGADASADPPVCGNDIVEPPEDCEPPGINNSPDCPQTDSCVGPLLYDVDDFGYCNGSCMCILDTVAGQCNIAQCGAQCETHADCPDGQSCNPWQCVCENAPGVRSRVDTDSDGFSDYFEGCMGTDPLDDCADTKTANDEHPDPWPPDFDDNQVCDVTDFLFFVDKFPSAVTEPGDERWDFDCNLVVDVTDALMFLAYYPSAC